MKTYDLRFWNVILDTYSLSKLKKKRYCNLKKCMEVCNFGKISIDWIQSQDLNFEKCNLQNWISQDGIFELKKKLKHNQT